MNANDMMIHGFTAILNQAIAIAVSEAIKPLQARILALEAGEWAATEHLVAKAIKPLQDRVIVLEIKVRNV